MEALRTVRTDLFRSDGVDAALLVTLGGTTVAILAGELALYLGVVRIALLLHLLTFVGCLLVAVVSTVETDLLRALVLLPLFRLLNLGTPVLFETTLAWLAVVYGVLVVATVVTAVTLPVARLPIRRDVRALVVYSPLVAGGALALGAVEHAIRLPEPLVASPGGIDWLPFVVVAVGLVGLGQEFLFRGVVQSTLAAHVGSGPAVVLPAVLFGAMHAGSMDPVVVAWGLLVGLLFGLYYQLTANWVVTGVLSGTVTVLVYGVLPVWGPLPLPVVPG